MTRRRRYLFWGSGALTLATMFVMVVPLITQGASQFADPAFQTQWQSVESVMPNFWGPLTTARDGESEAYVQGTYNGQAGQRLVQYFDKARMELTNPGTGKVTNGLLTVELKTGTLQLGDDTFQQYPGANIGIAGDPGQPGPTYASLGQLPESQPQTTGSVSLAYNATTNTFATGMASTDPNAMFSSYLSDPTGRYGQNIPKAFTDFMAKIPGGAIPAMGYAIGPAFQASITVNGTANVPVIIQPFQRRVLTYTASNQPAFQVEFGNIGQHYYQWRYQIITGAAATASAIVTCVTPTFTPTSTGTLTATPTGTVTATPTVAPICTTDTQSTVCATATYTPTSTGTLTATPRGTLTPTPTAAPICTTNATATFCATATATPYGSSTATFTPTVGIGTPTATYAGYVNVCDPNAFYGTATVGYDATGTAIDATNTAYAATYYAGDDVTNTAYAATSTALSNQYDATNTAYAASSTVLSMQYDATNTAYAAFTSTPDATGTAVAVFVSTQTAFAGAQAAFSATQTAFTTPGAAGAANTSVAAAATSTTGAAIAATTAAAGATKAALGTVPATVPSGHPSGSVIAATLTTAQVAAAQTAAVSQTATAVSKTQTAAAVAALTATAVSKTQTAQAVAAQAVAAQTAAVQTTAAQTVAAAATRTAGPGATQTAVVATACAGLPQPCPAPKPPMHP